MINTGRVPHVPAWRRAWVRVKRGNLYTRVSEHWVFTVGVTWNEWLAGIVIDWRDGRFEFRLPLLRVVLKRGGLVELGEMFAHHVRRKLNEESILRQTHIPVTLGDEKTS